MRYFNKIKLIVWSFVFCFTFQSFGQSDKTLVPMAQPDADGRIITGRVGSNYWNKFMENADLSDYHHASPEAVEAFKDMKFGLRIHWGIYSFVHGQESWVIPKVFKNEPEIMEWYHNLYQGWYPDAFDANKWMQMAKDWGFTFFVFTTKHHEGFSLYDTKYKITNKLAFVGPDKGEIVPFGKYYSVMETPFKRDITREIVDAGRKKGLKIGLYYSNPDWFDADFRFRKPDADQSFTPEKNPEEFARFRERHAGQIKELLSNYGKIDMLSLDLNMPEICWPHMQQTARMSRELQPDVMIRWRGIGNYGDYQTPENVIPGDADLGTMPWQVIHTLSKRDIFSYEPDETQLRDGKWIIETLVDIVAKGGNFMVGVGPDIRGNWHPKVIEALNFSGNWLKTYGEAIYGTRPCEVYGEGPVKEHEKASDKQNREEYLKFSDTDFRYTKKGNCIYVFQYGNAKPNSTILLKAAVPDHGKVKSITAILNNVGLKFTQESNELEVVLPEKLDEVVSVYKIELKP